MPSARVCAITLFGLWGGVLHNLGERAAPKGDHRRTARQCLHRGQRTRFLDQRRHEQAPRPLQKLAFGIEPGRPNEDAPLIQTMLYLLGEISLVVSVGKNLAGNHEVGIGALRGFDC